VEVASAEAQRFDALYHNTHTPFEWIVAGVADERGRGKTLWPVTLLPQNLDADQLNAALLSQVG